MHRRGSEPIPSGTLSEGKHELLVIIEDTTLFVRTQDHTTLHSTTVTWDVMASPTGIKTLSVSENTFRINPLPFDSYLSVSNKQPQQKETRIELLSLSGVLMTSATFQDDADCSLSTSQLAAGVYLLCVYQNNQLVYQRKVIKR